MTDDDLSIQADFLGAIHGVRSFDGARRRASTMTIGGHDLHVLSLEDIVKSKTAANRPKDRAVLLTLKATLHASRAKKKTLRAVDASSPLFVARRRPRSTR